MSKDNYYNIQETLKPIIEAYNKSIPAKPDIYGDGYTKEFESFASYKRYQTD